MVVKGLFSLIQDCPEACRIISIEKMSNEHRRSSGCSPVLVVDGSHFLPFFCAYRKGSPKSIYGGQWIELKEALKEFVLKFASKGIKLVFIFDGTTSEEMLTDWAKRKMNKYREIASIFKDISQNLQGKVIARRHASPALKLLAKFALKESAVGIYQTDKGVNADNYIADYANKNRAVFAILSNNSEFIIMNTKPMLLTSQLRLKQLETVMYDRRCFAERYLNISVKQLPLFACLMGKNYTPPQQLTQFNQSLAEFEKPSIDAKFKNLCALITQKKWTGDFNNEEELSSIAGEVFGDENKSGLVKHELESYVTDKVAIPLTLFVKMNPDFEQAIRERHFNCSNVCIFNLLCKREYWSSEVLEDGSRMASALVYREIRQRCYGILFNCFVEPGSEDSIVIEERCWYKKNQNENNNLREPERIHPLPLRSTSDLIKIEDLWFGCSEKRRFEFFWHILQIPMEFDILMQLPEDQVAISCILNYLIGGLKSGPLLEPLDVAAFVAQAVWKPSALDIKQLENPQVCPSTVNLSTLFVNGIEPVLMALETCGFPSPYKYTLPWQFFDGKLFHFLHNEAKNRPRVRVLCNDQDEIVKRFYQLLPVVTSRTEYDPERFEWRNILKDFYLEQNIKS
ncbi:constitutive coactivator of peroxisome proliferator-activated receptor gamma-like isoform X1 [Argiope bruennichi]|uniref:constitutive coactivator of peroxisome proliferator-activated receptor gamma-like isoform X1 n=1 Tax=Argiope bruennichi TaxID=94029 RepID=UPI00249523CE|nr:constitutive coactivator of peroxisome proliferator-activated receptor gamma-like isoform X1 [Argiope bruennichi]